MEGPPPGLREHPENSPGVVSAQDHPAEAGPGGGLSAGESPRSRSHQPSTSPRPRDQGIPVLAVWGLLSAALLFFVVCFGPQHPRHDDWQNLPYLLSRDLPSWHNLTIPWWQHRVPFLRVILRWLAQASHFNWQVPMLLSVVLLSTSALLYIGLIRRLRGRLVLSDLVIPLLCLSPGHWENLLQGWNLQNVAFAFLAGLCLLILIRQPNLRLGQAGLLLVVLTTLPWISGGSGAILALGLAATLLVRTLWRLIASVHAAVPPGAVEAGLRRRLLNAMPDVATLFLTVVSLLCTWANLAGLKAEAVEETTVPNIAVSTAELLTGPIAGRVPIWNHAVVWAVGLMLLICTCGAFLQLIRRERLCDRNWLIAGFLGSCGIAAVVIAWARSGVEADICQLSRYTTVFLPLTVAIYLLLVLTGTTWSRIAQRTLLACVLIAIPLKAQEAIANASEMLVGSMAFEEDARRGKPSSYLVEHYEWLIPTWKRGEATPYQRYQLFVRLELLRAQGIRPFSPKRATRSELPSME